MNRSAAALAHPNIAFIKYWGNRDDALRLPANGSVSMNLVSIHLDGVVRQHAVQGSQVVT